ncbi:MAG: efflux RND transporter periplasmic adaptor subunit [Clostridia bacterium]|nr:efflux RND transporter periplasmic adaptor subunit [Clostridia bacterium]
MSKTNVSIGVMIATFIAVMALFFWPDSSVPKLKVAIVCPGALQRECMLQGTAIEGEQVPIVTPFGGRVAQVYAKSGEYVQQGQLLIRLDSQLEEDALAQLEIQQHQLKSQLSQWIDPAFENGSQFALLTELSKQRDSIVAAIEYKQIRATSTGKLENLYIKADDYLSEAGLIGNLSTGGNKVMASWIAQQGQPPLPGLQAWWCKTDGTKLESMILERVGVPTEHNNQLIYPLTFRSTGLPSNITPGETAPVCLLLEAVQVNAMVPVEAIDSNGQVWVLRNGYAEPVSVEYGQHNDAFLQVQNELIGETVLLNPDELPLRKGMLIRRSEGL